MLKLIMMKASLPLPDGTPSYQSHKRQFIWQIILPMALAVMLVIAAGVYTASGSVDKVSQWADISLIWLLIPLMLFSLIFLVILAGLIYAIARLLKILPTYTQRAQKLAKRVEQGASRAADASVKPVFFVEGLLASLRVFMRSK